MTNKNITVSDIIDKFTVEIFSLDTKFEIGQKYLVYGIIKDAINVCNKEDKSADFEVVKGIGTIFFVDGDKAKLKSSRKLYLDNNLIDLKMASKIFKIKEDKLMEHIDGKFLIVPFLGVKKGDFLKRTN